MAFISQCKKIDPEIGQYVPDKATQRKSPVKIVDPAR
jgi:hypothetical protein